MRMEIINYLLHGEAGMSVKSICDRVINGDESKLLDFPYDPSDLRRCLLFCEACEIDIEIMRGVSDQWDALVEDWALLKDTFDRELKENGINGKAMDTYALMKEILT